MPTPEGLLERPSRRDAAPRGRRRDPRRFPHDILILGGNAGVAPGRGAGLPEGEAGSFAETGGAAAGIGGLPAWGRCRVPKAPKNRYLPKQQIKRHKHASRMGSVPAEPR